MATIDEQFTAQSVRFAQEFNTLRANELGIREDLLTTDKTTLVKAINEIYGMLSGDLPTPGSIINDDVTGLSTTWSSRKLADKFAALPPAGAQIDDINVSNDKVWSSTKTKAMIDESAGGVIDDTLTTTQNTWSAQKIRGEIDAGGGGGGAEIDDTTTASDKVWSSTKTDAAIQAALASAPPYVLPVATATVLGGVKVGQYLAIDLNGILRVVLTKGDLGLGNVDNTSDVNKPVSTAQNTAINAAVAGVTKTSLGLGNVDNTSDANKPVSTAQNTAINAAVAGVTKTSLGLGNVENKSSATIRGEITTANITSAGGVLATSLGAVNGVATLDAGGKVPAGQLPSYVDDVLEFANVAAFPAVGEGGKIYIDTSTNINPQWRWTGSQYVNMVSSPGTTDAVAEGSTNLYFTQPRVRVTLLTGMVTSDAGAVTAGDSVLTAFGKLQARTAANATAISAIDKTSIGLGNVENKSSATIRGEITTANITTALSYTPGHQIFVTDEGAAIGGGTTEASLINFVGAGVTATQTGGNVTITIPGAGSSLTSTDQLAEGSVNLYYTDARTRSAVMTGISFATATAVVAADTVLQAVGKLQAQATANAAAVAGITKTSLGLGNVENKSSSDIRGELTAANVNAALTYTAGRQITAQDEGSPLAAGAAVQSINIVGSGATATQTGGNLTITIPGSSGPANTDALTEGSTNLYFTAARVLSTVLTGLSTATNAVITASDSVLSAMGKLQKQISDLATSAVSTAGVQTLTNKTLDNCTITGFKETGVTASGTSCVISYLTGTDTEYTTTGNVTVILPNADASPGRSGTLTIIYGGAHTVTFTGGGVAGATTIKYASNVAPVATSVAGKRDFYALKVDRAGTHTAVLDAGRNF